MPEEPTAPEKLDPQVQQPEPTDGGQACPGPHTVITPEAPAPEPGPDKEPQTPDDAPDAPAPDPEEVKPEAPGLDPAQPAPCEDPTKQAEGGDCCPG